MSEYVQEWVPTMVLIISNALAPSAQSGKFGS